MAMGAYWNSLTTRERWIVKLGIAAVAGILFYLWVWEPKANDLQQLRMEVPQQRAILAWMQEEFKRAAPLLEQHRQVAGDTGPLLTVIEQTAQANRVREALQRMQPVTGGEVRVWFQDVVADDWLRWLDALVGQGVGVSSTTVTRTEDGLISVRVTVAR